MRLFRRRKWYGPGLQDDIKGLARVIQQHYSEYIIDGSAPKVAQRILENESAELMMYRAAIDSALHELGIPQPGYPTNAISILQEAQSRRVRSKHDQNSSGHSDRSA